MADSELSPDDRAAALAEAYKRGLLPPEMKSAYEEAQKRGLVKAAPAEPSDYSKFMRGQEGPAGKPMSRWERFGTGVRDIAEGTLQAAAHMPVADPAGAAYVAAHPEIQKIQQQAGKQADAREAKRESQIKADETASGVTGIDWARLGGNIAGTAPLAALNPVAAGAASGSLTPVTSGDYEKEKAKQILFGAAAGKLGQVGGNVLAKIVRPAAEAAIKPVVDIARRAGYVLPPQMMTDRPGVVANALSGWSGKIKTAQAASAKNQEVTNDLAKKALGLPKDAELTPQAFKDVRAEAGKAYQAVKDRIPTTILDDEFYTKVSQIGGAGSQAAEMFPEIYKRAGVDDLTQSLLKHEEMPTDVAMDLVKQLRYDANLNLKAPGAPDKHALGLAQREAAGHLDDAIDRNVSAAAKSDAALGRSETGDLASAYRNARQQIAKSYDVQAVTNGATGDVNAAGLARLSDKGRPLSGELKAIADTANAFPKAVQNPAKFGGDEPMSALDFFGSALAVAHGRPSIAAAIMGRPLARSALLSDAMQNYLAPPKGSGMELLRSFASSAPQTRNMLANLARQGGQVAAPAAAMGANAMVGP